MSSPLAASLILKAVSDDCYDDPYTGPFSQNKINVTVESYAASALKYFLKDA